MSRTMKPSHPSTTHAFVELLQSRANEQKTLMDQSILPSWMSGPTYIINAYAPLVIIMASCIVSLFLITLFFPWFFDVSVRLIGEPKIW